jgi:hypothetical protein
MTGEQEGTTQPLLPGGSGLGDWARQRRDVARTLREQAEQMRARTADLRQTLQGRRAAPIDTAALRRRLEVAERRAGNLQVALVSNRRIGMAIGILMARRGLTDVQAFDVLREYSNRRNVKLAAAAEDVLHTGELRGLSA